MCFSQNSFVSFRVQFARFFDAATMKFMEIHLQKLGLYEQESGKYEHFVIQQVKEIIHGVAIEVLQMELKRKWAWKS